MTGILRNQADIEKVIGNGEVVTLDQAAQLLTALPGLARPRIYAYLGTGESSGQCVRLLSDYYIEKYGENIQFAWISYTTTADLIGRA